MLQSAPEHAILRKKIQKSSGVGGGGTAPPQTLPSGRRTPPHPPPLAPAAPAAPRPSCLRHSLMHPLLGSLATGLCSPSYINFTTFILTSTLTYSLIYSMYTAIFSPFQIIVVKKVTNFNNFQHTTQGCKYNWRDENLPSHPFLPSSFLTSPYSSGKILTYRPGGIAAGTQQREIASFVLCRTVGGLQCKPLLSTDPTSVMELIT